MTSQGIQNSIIAGISVIGIAATIFLLPTAYSYYEQQRAPPAPVLTQMNLILEPHQTQDMNHSWTGQVMEARIKPNGSEEEPVPDYELLITVVEPRGYTIFNKR